MKTFFLKNNLYSLLFLFFLVSFQSYVEASEASENALIEQLKALGSFQSLYEQQVFNQEEEKIESAQGHFYLGNNKAFRNDITQPEKSKVISDGTSLWLIDDDLEQVSISLLSSYLADSPLALLLDKTEGALKAYDVKKLDSPKSELSLFELNAQGGYDSVKTIRVAFQAKEIEYIEIDDRRGRRIRVDFASVKPLRNTNIFKADFPSHYDVVDETH